ncbi:hypothetical protein K8352_07585 [Flavobacteriaceae bacterium F89]|uniref:Fibronectin type-III domain-containing protein n=1 Tax=Cerina litoralis TaxID=2874477 RepID=A0AAE3JQU4_9FLAO|nr:hypothetical protein [Cerina litoralis]MCG2460603.1 hypothetical protein [Cerina litoralis]
MNRIFFIICTIFLFGCGGNDDPPAKPERVRLIYPEKDSECNTGIIIDDLSSRVEFKWQASNNTDIYEVRVTNLNTSVTQTISTASLSAKLPLQKGAPYSWFVTSKNSQVPETATSEVWRFYNSGFVTTYPPFPAEIISPKSGASVFKDINNEITLEWSGADVDEDLLGFEVYFSSENPPVALVATLAADFVDYKVSVLSNTVYYWRIISKDKAGNTSDSGVYEFKVL